MFAVKIKRKALKNLAKIDQEQKRHLKETILLLKNDPLPFKKTDICKLKGYDNTYRIRIGKHKDCLRCYMETKDNFDPLCRDKRKSLQLINLVAV